MTTPAQATRGLWNQAWRLPYTIAPERAKELQELLGPDKWVLKPSDTAANLYAVVEDRAVFVSYAGLASLWCLTFAAFHTMNAATRTRQQAEPGQTIDFGLYWGRLQLTRYVDYARELARSAAVPWPDGLQLPAPRAPLDSVEGRANNLCFGALGWLMLHELGHILCLHTRFVDRQGSMRQETEADAFATHWVLDKVGNGHRRDFRVMAITVSLAWLLIHEQAKGSGSPTHPPAIQRFQAAVANFEMSEDSVGLESVTYMLKALFDPKSQPPPNVSAGDAFDWVCDQVVPAVHARPAASWARAVRSISQSPDLALQADLSQAAARKGHENAGCRATWRTAGGGDVLLTGSGSSWRHSATPVGEPQPRCRERIGEPGHEGAIDANDSAEPCRPRRVPVRRT